MTTTRWTTCGRKLLRDGRAFFVRGVNYAPTPIGRDARVDMLGDPRVFQRDLANLRRMHANAVKTYDFDTAVDHSPFLDAAFNGGAQPIYVVFSLWIDEALMASGVRASGAAFQAAARGYFEMARRTGAHPATMGYSIGGELNRHRIVRDAQFWEKFGLLTSAVRRGLAAAGGAAKVITTTFMDDTARSFRAGARFRADVDLWGANLYRSDLASAVLPTFLSVPGGKPLLVSEYGVPCASNAREGNASELATVARAIVDQSAALQRNFEARDALREQVAVGGFVFEYSDEWWKAGAVDVHDFGVMRGANFPLGYWAEEFFGLFSASRAAPVSGNGNGSGLNATVDELHARPTVALLTELWGRGALATEHADHAACNYTAEALAAKRDEALYAPRGLGFLGWLAVVILVGIASVVGAALVRKKLRRAGYRKIPVLVQ
ncbi:hypothetical protein PybrP1_010974 [[Pythium] brassicae (nom. inval.)]|nr:hypothetical protein PybrP1_010974 [[Pythium] brassicae (nom. inval.)]